MSFCLAREYGSSRLVFFINEGDRMQLHASAAGRVLMAYGPDALREKILGGDWLERFTPRTIVDPEKIKAELYLIRERGYAINRGQRKLEVAALAAPIFNHDNQVTTTLVIVGPEQRFSDERISEMLNNLLAATRKISILMGASL
jgi:IclR family acetate operon transcriptional repressor